MAAYAAICIIFLRGISRSIEKRSDMRNRILDMLKTADNYISGEQMSRELGISRAAVWKHINKLKAEGYDILSVTNKGYRLKSVPDNIDASRITARLKTEFIARNIRYVNVTDSTNDEAKRCSEMPDGSLIIAEVQTAGKGRLGRAWTSPRGAGVWMTLLLKPEIDPYRVSQITLIAGIAVCHAIGRDARIKWPNDIVIGGKKTCGILTEMAAETDRIAYVLCGIGINVNTPDFPAELKDKATSMYIETGVIQDREEVAAKTLNEFERLYKIFIKDGFEPLLDEYRRDCVTLNKRVRLIYNHETVTGTAVDVSSDGALVVDTDNGRISVTSGEVSVRGIYGYI